MFIVGRRWAALCHAVSGKAPFKVKARHANSPYRSFDETQGGFADITILQLPTIDGVNGLPVSFLLRI